MPIPNPSDAYSSPLITSVSPYDSGSGIPAPPMMDATGAHLYTSNPWWNTALMGLGWLVVIGIGIHLLNERRGFPEDLGHVRFDGHSVIVVGLAASVFIITTKFLTARFNVPGLSPVVQTYL